MPNDYVGYADTVCKYVYTTGRRAGQDCDQPVDGEDGYCFRHAKVAAAKKRNGKQVRRPSVQHRRDLQEDTARKQLARRIDIAGMLATGDIKVDDLSWDELKGGFIYQRDADGKILDKLEPEFLPRTMYQQITRALIMRAEHQFREHYDDALKAIVELVENPRTPARERLAAAQYIIERCIGKIPDKQLVDVTVSEFQTIVDSGELVVDIEVEDVDKGAA